MTRALLLVLTSATAQGQAVELRSARLVLPSGEERSVDGGVYVSEPEFTRYVSRCTQCAETRRPQEPQPGSASGYLWSTLVGAVLGFAGGLWLVLSLRP